MASLYQHKKTGQIVEMVAFHGLDAAMIKTSGGGVTIAQLEDLLEYEPGKGRTNVTPQPISPKDEEPDVPPQATIPEDHRLNLNLATAEMIANRINGIGYITAKRLIELRMSLPGERFRNLDQVRKIGRVDWDRIIEDDLIFVG